MTVIVSASSCQEMSTYLPLFVTEAKDIETVRLTRQDNTVEFQIVFVAATDKAKRDFDQLQGDSPDQCCQSSPKGGGGGGDLVLCNGPCGQLCKPEGIVQFGDCDHNICQTCLDSGVKKLFDGLRGCCNANCLTRKTSSRNTSRNSSVRATSRSRRDKKKHNKKTQTEPSKSSNSDCISTTTPSLPSKATEPGSNQLIAVSLFVFCLEKKRIVRRNLELELLGNTRASFLLEKAKSFCSKKGRSRFYYTTMSRFTRKDLFEVSDCETTTIGQLARNEEQPLSVLVATPGTKHNRVLSAGESVRVGRKCTERAARLSHYTRESTISRESPEWTASSDPAVGTKQFPPAYTSPLVFLDHAMGNYKSRPTTSCSDELKKKISECYAVVRSRLGDDCRPRAAIWNQTQNAAYERSYEDFISTLSAASLDNQTPQKLNLLHLICAGHSENQHSKVTALLEKCDESQRATLLSQLTNNGFSPLHLAIHKGDVLVIKELLKEGADPAQAGRHVLPPLHLAAMMGNETAVQALLNAGAPLYSPDFVKFTPLHCATYSAHDQVVRLLLDRGADANIAGGVRDRPLHLAAARGLLNIATMLLNAGADPLLADDEGTLALHFAARTGHLSVLQLLLQKTTAVAEAVATRNVYGDTPLHVACYGGRLDVVRSLLPIASSTVLTMENVFSETPFHAACTGGRSVELVAVLLRQPGIHANAQGMDGHTPLHSACYHGHLRIVQYLLENGADQSLTARAMDTPLAVNQPPGAVKPSPIAQAMIRLNRPDPPSPNMSSHDSTLSFEDNQTPIIWAYERGHDHIVALLKHYANQSPENDVASEYSSGESSYTPLPSPMGRLHSMTREKAEILQLRGALRPQNHLSLGEVDFQEAIGSGSFGKVYRGTYRGKVVAIKRYRAMAYGCKSEVDMLCREVSILSRVGDHPNVIGFIGAALDDKSQFAIVTEFAENGSLFSIIHEQKRVLEPSFRLRASLDVARGMRYLHELSSQPVIHRDLNSHNILIHIDGRAVVADFGESRFASHAEESSSMTKQPGNLRWMAPEVFSQCGRYDKSVDTFSYALVVWETHAAELPFGHLKPAAAAAEMAYKKGRPGLPANPTVQFPAHILALLPQAWHSDPAERPSFSEIVPLLEPYVDSQANMETQASVSQLKTQWEQLCVTPVKTVSSSQLPPPFHRLSASGTVEELRQRLDRNGYITQSPKS